MTLKEKVNGHKKAIAIWGLSITVVLAVGGAQITFNGRVIANERDIIHNCENIEELKKTPVQIGKLEENVEALNEKFIDFRTEQRVANRHIDNKIDKILEAVK